MRVSNVTIDTRGLPSGGTEVLLEMDTCQKDGRGKLRELVVLPDSPATDLLLHHIKRLSR